MHRKIERLLVSIAALLALGAGLARALTLTPDQVSVTWNGVGPWVQTISPLGNDLGTVTLTAPAGTVAGVLGDLTCAFGVCRYSVRPDAKAAAGSTTVETFAYAAEDGLGATAQSTITLSVQVVNAPPAPGEDLVILTAGATAPTTIPVLDNDTDPDFDDQLSGLVLATPPALGTANCSGQFCTYLPPARARTAARLEDTFTYQVQDRLGQLATGRVVVVLDVPGGRAAPSPTQPGTSSPVQPNQQIVSPRNGRCVGVVFSAWNSRTREGQTATIPQTTRARWTQEVLAGAGFGVLPMSDADMNSPKRLHRCPVVVTPYVFLMSARQRAGLRDYVKGGGGLVALYGTARSELDGTRLIDVTHTSTREWSELTDVFQSVFDNDVTTSALRLIGAPGDPIATRAAKIAKVKRLVIEFPRFDWIELFHGVTKNVSPVLTYASIGQNSDRSRLQVGDEAISRQAYGKGRGVLVGFKLMDLFPRRVGYTRSQAEALLIAMTEWAAKGKARGRV